MKKRIDWKKMPTDVVCRDDDYNYFYHIGGGMFSDLPLRFSKNPILTTPLSKGILLDENQPIVAWFGGECPVADGVLTRIWYRNGYSTCEQSRAHLYTWNYATSKGILPKKENEIIAYQIIGLEEGWTV